MPNNKVKSLKKIGKIENCHPYSRKAQQAKRAMLRDDRISRTRNERDSLKVARQVEQYMFVKILIPTDPKPFSMEQMQQVAEAWLHRHDEELQELIDERNSQLHGKKKPKEDLLLAMSEEERKAYEKNGIVLPNLMSTKVVEALSAWKGDMNQADLIKTIVIRPSKKGSPPTEQQTIEQKIECLTGMAVE